MDRLLSCDWGTSSFRLRLVEVPSVKILSEYTSASGIASVYDTWRSDHVGKDRLRFYLDHVLSAIGQIEKDFGRDLSSVPLILSGMASSSIGMQEMDYAPLPVSVTGEGIDTRLWEMSSEFPHPVLLISGVRTERDAMRGEETQLIGLLQTLKKERGSRLFILPGTHSKHVMVENEKMVDLKTYMTGEFFSLLSQKSILSASVENYKDREKPGYKENFRQGVRDSVGSDILNSAFRVRTGQLFGRIGKSENYDYLSGLLIGSELKELMNHDFDKIYLCSGSGLESAYAEALRELGVHRMEIIQGGQMDRAVVLGQYHIYKRMNQ